MSPLLFLLIIEGLNHSIGLAKTRGDIRGVQVSPHHSLTHLFFVANVLLFGILCPVEWRRYHDIISIFCDAIGMEICPSKSCFLTPMEVMEPHILELFPFDHRMIDFGINYLGFSLKPNGYNKTDWAWLVEHVEHKIGLWCYRWLSLGGKITLIKSGLEGIPIYWMTLFKIPKSILDDQRRYAASYLWSGNSLHGKIHLTKWSMIART